MTEPRHTKPRGSKPERSDRDRKRTPEPASQGRFSAAAIREVVESIVVAFVLAFLFRTFEAEAFVIPTGSMAPTLMGRHRDVSCTKCGFPYQVSASEEVDESGASRGVRVASGTCPMCRFTMDMRPGLAADQAGVSFKGDRILVGKFPFHFGDPQRWDVAVFRYPGKARVNYIKRIAGLPNETLRIQYGDVWTKPDAADDFQMARKPPEKVLAMMQPVYDSDYVLPELVSRGVPMRWGPMGEDRAGGWRASPDLKSFSTDGSSDDDVWLAYQHVVPTYQHWAAWEGEHGPNFLGDREERIAPPPPQLISDFTAYNTSSHDQQPDPGRLGLHWVGDLTLECQINAESGNGEVLLELIKGGAAFLCRLDLTAGTASLAIPGFDDFQAVSKDGIRGPGKHRVRFANVDDQLLLWLDGRLVKFDSPTTYDSRVVDTSVPNREDLHPVRVGSKGAAVKVSSLKIFRDIYYIAQRAHTPGMDYEESPFDSHPQWLQPQDPVAKFLSSPDEWGAFRHRRRIEFPLGKDQYFALGDNSASSKDSRLWEDDAPQYYVNRELLIGKAFFIYWPHSWDRIPGTSIPFPFFPNFARMGFVR